VSYAESVPEDDIGVGNGSGGVGSNPGGKASGGLAGGLRDMAAGRVDLGVVVCDLVSTAQKSYRLD